MKLSLLTLPVAATVAAATTTGRAEVDILFPRNDTFAPTPLLPILFAVQNPAVAQQLNLRLHYRVIPHGQPNATTDYELVRLNGLPANDTTFYVHAFVEGLLKDEGAWELFWQLRWNNCTATEDADGEKRFARDTEEPVQSFVFTTRNGGAGTELTGGGECGDAQGIAFDVLDVLDVPPSQNADMLSSCAQVAVPAPTPTPCSAAVPSDAAESISSRITQAACLSATPVVSCPAKDNASGRAVISVAAAVMSLASAMYAFAL